MVQSVKTPDFNSKAIKTETQCIISTLKEDPQKTKDVFVCAARIVRTAFSKFKHQNRDMSTINILRSPKFNQLVESQTLKAIANS